MHGPIPFGMQQYMNFNNLQPSEVKGRNNPDCLVERRYLYTKLASCYEFTLPKQWAKNFFRYWLFLAGSIAVIYTKELGWIAYPYGIVKLDYQYQPAEIVVYNHFLNTDKTGVVGLNCGIVRVMDDFFGLEDLIQKYAEKLSQINRAIDVNLMNSNVAMVLEADSKKQADTLKEAYAEATTGKPMVAINKNLLNGEGLNPLINNVKQNYIVNDLLTARRTLMNNFLTEIGIANTNYEKRAQMSDDEINQNNDESSAIASVILENIQDGFEKINAISDLGLGVKLRYDYQKGGAMNVVSRKDRN